MSEVFGTLIILAIAAIPVLLVVLAIRALMKKPINKIAIAIAVCVASLVPLAILGTITNPATWCEHEYSIVEEIPATCTEEGKVVKVCSLCNTETEENLSKTEHSWVSVSVFNATCTEGGYKDERCANCSNTRRADTGPALGHSMVEVSRVDPTYEADGLVVSKCERCSYEETVTLEKLIHETVKFDGLELVFGEYTFTEFTNKYSEFYGKEIVKIPVTITNISDEPHSLMLFYYKLFGTSGVESGNVGIFLSDDVSQAGDLLPGKSYVKYFHIVYDGDGTYTIVLDNGWYSKETVQIEVKK